MVVHTSHINKDKTSKRGCECFYLIKKQHVAQCRTLVHIFSQNSQHFKAELDNSAAPYLIR